MTFASTTRTLGVAALGAAATVAAVVSTGTTAAADATADGITVHGNTFQVGCSYTLTGPWDVYGFSDTTDANSTGRVTDSLIDGSGIGSTSATWTPTVAGTHTLYGEHMLGITDAPGQPYGPVTVQVVAATPGQACTAGTAGLSTGSSISG